MQLITLSLYFNGIIAHLLIAMQVGAHTRDREKDSFMQREANRVYIICTRFRAYYIIAINDQFTITNTGLSL